MSVLSKNNIVLLKTISKLSLNLAQTLDISILQQNISILNKTFELNTIQIHNFQSFMLRNMFVYCLSSHLYAVYFQTDYWRQNVQSGLIHDCYTPTPPLTPGWTMIRINSIELKLVPNVARVELRSNTPYSCTPPTTHTWTDADQKRGYDMQPRAKRSKDWPNRVDMKTL